MNTLNTIIEEEKKKARKQFDDSPVSLRIDALERYAHVHGWSQFEGRTIQDEIDTIVTTAMQRAYEAGQAERDTYWKERVREIIKMADALELECGKDGDKGTKQWMAFKGFRNTIRDRFLTNEDNLK